MTTWADLRQRVRVALLRDNPTDASKRRWDDENLLYCCEWALDALCAHTAQVTGVTVTGVTGVTVEPPGNAYEGIEYAGQVILEGESKEPRYLRSRYVQEGIGARTTGDVFDIDSDGNIVFERKTEGDVTPLSVTLRYFARYDHPVEDDDPIQAHPKFYAALAYMIGAYANANYMMSSAQIRQWVDKSDRGGPEDNSFVVAMQWFTKVYERELARIPEQRRRSYFWQDK